MKKDLLVNVAAPFSMILKGFTIHEKIYSSTYVMLYFLQDKGGREVKTDRVQLLTTVWCYK